MVQVRAMRRARCVIGMPVVGLAISVFVPACFGPRERPAPLPAAPPATAPAMLASIPVGEGVPRMVIAPDGRHLYAANDKLMVIDAAANMVVQMRKLNDVATRIAIAPDGSRLYITTLLAKKLTVYDTVHNKIATPIKLYEPYFHGRIVAAPDNRTLYIADSQNQALGVVDLTSGGHRLLKPSVWPYDVAVSRDGRTVYSAGCKQSCRPGYLQRFDVATQQFTQELPIAGHPHRLILSPDGQRAYVVHLGPPSVSSIDLAAWRVIATVPLPRTFTEAGTPDEAAISPDGATLYVTSQELGTVTAVDTATTALRSQMSVFLAHDIVLAPDGSRLYVSTTGDVSELARVEPPRNGFDRGREFGDATNRISGTSSVMVIAPRAAQ